MIIVIDNYDSFTYNLVQYIGELGAELPIAQDIRVYRNDKISLDEIRQQQPDAIVISPGPGRPEDAGISPDIIRELGSNTPIFGVCLGHQAMGLVFGGQITSAPTLMHGKTSEVHHNNTGVFRGLENPFLATRYHSLVIERQSCPEELEITAWVDDGTIMGVRHRNYPHIEGVQFHPESILTQAGKQLLRNFLTSIPSAKIAVSA
ncbi:aminodeoxychorismate/anthranilate synthase component II [Desertifilum sp. FACHB-1129]|uniref:Aminodeoxychorismate/anthranilate synthase component II n=1 Tax=Desertifilum tharense IPPAS B-1220 TaxID=1781255 RepID=A0A1E5QJF8_9CYAN|nr:MULTISPECIES: aminodeoxychorismate/anthranilate synthase component II [Desertifilum]MBD2314534.1 aminodeoxychorismate/anthranilate synthase component II [Desertifilum sp. FACHB-1129]MBD2321065.1 aminodeoxychorismate/anthranilate synthase component II [Desertifilum sp. FACHB-866]MBD2331626.1 aminodeoxychorismate/anthranilate synthase component II [Desertifilum sp. FACHB-868]OEJ74697.1 aminodeoxychorismate/anthranilate synthase component II [Desertifilum tharense IPPAS B-1220]